MCNAESVEAYEKDCSKRIMLSAVTMRNCVVVAPIQARGGSSTMRPDGKSRHQPKRDPNENLWVRKRGVFLLPGQLAFEKMVHCCLEKLRVRTISLLCSFSCSTGSSRARERKIYSSRKRRDIRQTTKILAEYVSTCEDLGAFGCKCDYSMA